ncbi:MAG: hypothetical protein AUJ51_07335 [Elusimicrobia bacterium CG1_02_56_21]|nr:MAG: hypothetical protein AUJ51_07335 [Elusimicrobia bacterium CG1_02_56_21]
MFKFLLPFLFLLLVTVQAGVTGYKLESVTLETLREASLPPAPAVTVPGHVNFLGVNWEAWA